MYVYLHTKFIPILEKKLKKQKKCSNSLRPMYVYLHTKFIPILENVFKQPLIGWKWADVN